MKMKLLDHAMLLALNNSSIRGGRRENLAPDRLAGKPEERYWINESRVREETGLHEVCICIVLNLYAGKTAWLDISSDEFAAIPEIEVSDDEWETAMCAGTPPLTS